MESIRELQQREAALSHSMRTCSSSTAVPILLLLLLGTVPARAQPSCLHFPELLPAKLRELRVKFEEIKDYFVSITLLLSSHSAFFAKFWDLEEGEELPPS